MIIDKSSRDCLNRSAGSTPTVEIVRLTPTVEIVQDTPIVEISGSTPAVEISVDESLRGMQQTMQQR